MKICRIYYQLHLCSLRKARLKISQNKKSESDYFFVNLDGKLIAAYACESGAGAEKAFEKLKAALGIETFEAELILIDPKTKPSEENDQKLRLFCSKLM